MDLQTVFTMTVNGEPAAGAATFDVFNPATGAILAVAPDCGREQLDEAVAAAARAFVGWKATPMEQRQEMVRAIGTKLFENADPLMRLLTAEQGKPHAKAAEDVMGAGYWCHQMAGLTLPAELNEDSAERRSETRRVPIGVVAAIAPWNFPVFLAFMKVAPALLAGNTVILKPSPLTPLTTLRIGELLREVLPPGVLNVISGGDRLGPWLTAHPGIGKVSFTGSTETGRKVMRSAAETLKRITLELGGNDAAIVLPDADVAATAEKLFWSAFGNTGQVCVATKRLYIHEDIYQPMAEALAAYAQSVKMGDGAEQGVQLGPIQNQAQFDRLLDLIADSKAAGHHFLLGGDALPGPGYFLPVTLIDNPPETSRIVREEQFGPVLPLLKFRDIDDVVRRANDTPYGLGASIWSGDADKAAALGERLEAGTVWINEAQYMNPMLAFGGHKQSGIGVENARDGLLEFTNTQVIVVRKMPAAA